MDSTHGCPHGNVHNVHKQTVGERLALQIRRMKLGEEVVSEGPRASGVTVAPGGAGAFAVTVGFDIRGSAGALYFAATRNCTDCCLSTMTSTSFLLPARFRHPATRAHLCVLYIFYIYFFYMAPLGRSC